MTVLRVGVDVGGTFTDIVAVDDVGNVYYTKTPSTPSDQSVGVAEGILKIAREIGGNARVIQVVHGTTVATNTLLERTGAITGLLTTEGFRDVLHIGRQSRPNLYDLQARRPDPLVPRRLRAEVAERIRHTGNVERPLDLDGLRETVQELVAQGVQSLAICFLHAYANPDHERLALAEVQRLVPDLPVSISSAILPEFREFERTSTTVLNAYVQPVMKHYLRRLSARLVEKQLDCPLMLMQSNGGMMSVESAASRPVNTLLSGPAGGVLAAGFLAQQTGRLDLITADVGGTSFDVAVVENGQPALRAESVIEGYPVRFPHIDIHTIGAGGGSVAWIDSGGALRAGPRSSGAVPGPVCYSRGGTEPAVTDAHAVLGRIGGENLLGGEMKLDLAAARQAIQEKIATPLGLTLEQAAEGILRVVNANMARAIRVMTVERGLDPRRFTLLGYGGAGPLHAVDLARQTGIRTVLMPVAPGNFSAFGLLAAPMRYDEVATYQTTAAQLNLDRLAGVFADLAHAAGGRLALDGCKPEEIVYERRIDLRYLGQAYELTAAFDGGPVDETAWEAAVGRFHALHEKTYGYARRDTPVEMVSVRVTGFVPSQTPHQALETARGAGAPRPDAMQPVYYDGRWIETPIYWRGNLLAGHRFTGPAIIKEKGSTSVLYPGDQAEVDRWGNIVIEIATNA